MPVSCTVNQFPSSVISGLRSETERQIRHVPHARDVFKPDIEPRRPEVNHPVPRHYGAGPLAAK
jgi:hypothetical protein